MASKRVVIGMSGGVDSSVSAWLLKEQGYEVIGLFMKNWEDDDDSEYCSSRQDWIDAASVADVVGVDIEAVNFAAEYKERVFSEFLREYQARNLAEGYGLVWNPGGPHTEPGCAVQCRNQVQGLSRSCFQTRRRPDRNRPLRARAPNRAGAASRAVPVAEGDRRQQGPELFPAPAEPEPVVEDAVPAGRNT